MRSLPMLSHTATHDGRTAAPAFGVPSREVNPADRAVELVAPYCDIVDRLKVMPPSAQCRGVWIKNVEKQIEKAGALERYREFFPNDRYKSIPFYPMQDFLIRLACAGALLKSPAEVHGGMFEVTKGNAVSFVDTVIGKLLLRALSKDPIRLIEQGMAARRQSFSYGHWELRRHSEREVEVAYQNEYWWIESAVAGAAVGTFEACNIAVRAETKLIDRFNGSTFCRW